MDPIENLRHPRKGHTEHFVKFVRDLQVLSPVAIYQRLEELGYRGQAAARRALALMAYRHVQRIRRLVLEGTRREQLMPKSNYLLLGPTGCGKTHLVELLFGKILALPTVVVDITTYSETGYVGQDTNTVLTRLLHAANDNPLVASVGVVCLDEFDKIASGQNNAIFAGAGTTKDVTGLGVQRELLKMLESSEIVVPLELTHSTYAEHVVMSTADVAFIAAGAFSGLPQLLRRRGLFERIGFGRGELDATSPEAIAVSLEPEDVEEITHFQVYGFLPELVARFTRIIPFEALSTATLRAILEDSVLGRLEREFEDEGLELRVDSEVLDFIVQQSVRRQTGARGLSSVLTRVLEEAAFEAFAQPGTGRVRLRLEDGRITVTR
ncbi:MAG: AAA family ATPase [Deltaproteobacteria bacterium]|nr:AAA family ATPase [Deltaproteobacteria bacterium]